MGSAPPPAADQLHTHSPSPSLPPANVTQGIMGKHRMTAAIAFLNQQIQILQDEIDELDNIGGVSTVCPELIASVDTVPDALLPVTRGPADVGWDRWFQGAHSSRSRRRWI
ncbi:Guanine nucleotide-binding protein subunit gamma 1 [Striga hermonthica]|uniref:Guanine nucleotide-binding protein subunit gamma 1 n=1 Tax=Striga hermonthica TaxID=68872 RepID=A0A9N7MU23_STRHE|nr:Guanine nucleotide-binding protein subunit gamma 1 [Striga hermonthica]